MSHRFRRAPSPLATASASRGSLRRGRAKRRQGDGQRRSSRRPGDSETDVFFLKRHRKAESYIESRPPQAGNACGGFQSTSGSVQNQRLCLLVLEAAGALRQRLSVLLWEIEAQKRRKRRKVSSSKFLEGGPTREGALGSGGGTGRLAGPGRLGEASLEAQEMAKNGGLELGSKSKLEEPEE